MILFRIQLQKTLLGSIWPDDSAIFQGYLCRGKNPRQSETSRCFCSSAWLGRENYGGFRSNTEEVQRTILTSRNGTYHTKNARINDYHPFPANGVVLEDLIRTFRVLQMIPSGFQPFRNINSSTNRTICPFLNPTNLPPRRTPWPFIHNIPCLSPRYL